MPKFLIIRFSSIGDIIQCMGIIDGIREHFPDAEIHWIARKDMSSFLAMDKRIGKIWAFDKALGLKGLLKIARQLREEHYDYIYDAHSNIRSNILRLKLFDSLVLILTPCVAKNAGKGFYFSIGVSTGFPGLSGVSFLTGNHF